MKFRKHIQCLAKVNAGNQPLMEVKKNHSLFKQAQKTVVAIEQVRSKKNWAKLSGEIDKLASARLSIAKLAKNGRPVKIINETNRVTSISLGGRYLVQPPLVAKDASLIRQDLKEKGLPSIILCREPKTKRGLCPVVSLGSGVIIRVQIEEPKDIEHPTCAWFDRAIDALGLQVISLAEKQDNVLRRLDFLVAHMPAVPSYRPIYIKARSLCQTLDTQCE